MRTAKTQPGDQSEFNGAIARYRRGTDVEEDLVIISQAVSRGIEGLSVEQVEAECLSTGR